MNIFNTSILVETKKEYTIQLVNILTPLIYDGLKAMYEDAINMGQGKDTLLIYQNLLRRIPKWPKDLIQKETQRIRDQSKCTEWFEDLIKAVVKANILILSNSASSLNESTKKYYEQVNIEDFIHKCYIQCGREIFNSPYLFYHKLTPVEIKRNQRDCCNLIKESIREAIRKMLPVKHILNQYLNNEFHDKIMSKEGNLLNQSPINKINNINNVEQNEGKADDEILKTLSEASQNLEKLDSTEDKFSIEEKPKENKTLSEKSDENKQSGGDLLELTGNRKDIMSSLQIKKLKKNSEKFLISSDSSDGENFKEIVFSENIKTKDIFGNLSDSNDSELINKKLENLKHITETGKETQKKETKSSSVEIKKLNLKEFDNIPIKLEDKSTEMSNKSDKSRISSDSTENKKESSDKMSDQKGGVKKENEMELDRIYRKKSESEQQSSVLNKRVHRIETDEDLKGGSKNRKSKSKEKHRDSKDLTEKKHRNSKSRDSKEERHRNRKSKSKDKKKKRKQVDTESSIAYQYNNDEDDDNYEGIYSNALHHSSKSKKNSKKTNRQFFSKYTNI